jgi:hypothetical protein
VTDVDELAGRIERSWADMATDPEAIIDAAAV